MSSRVRDKTSGTFIRALTILQFSSEFFCQFGDLDRFGIEMNDSRHEENYSTKSAHLIRLFSCFLLTFTATELLHFLSRRYFQD
jgi:hypothetical protein